MWWCGYQTAHAHYEQEAVRCLHLLQRSRQSPPNLAGLTSNRISQKRKRFFFFVERFSLISHHIKVKFQGDLKRIKCVVRSIENNHVVYLSLQVEEKVFQFIDQKQEYQVSGALGLNWVKLYFYHSVENPCSAKLPCDLKIVWSLMIEPLPLIIGSLGQAVFWQVSDVLNYEQKNHGHSSQDHSSQQVSNLRPVC